MTRALTSGVTNYIVNKTDECQCRELLISLQRCLVFSPGDVDDHVIINISPRIITTEWFLGLLELFLNIYQPFYFPYSIYYGRVKKLSPGLWFPVYRSFVCLSSISCYRDISEMVLVTDLKFGIKVSCEPKWVHETFGADWYVCLYLRLEINYSYHYIFEAVKSRDLEFDIQVTCRLKWTYEFWCWLVSSFVYLVVSEKLLVIMISPKWYDLNARILIKRVYLWLVHIF